MYLNRTEEGVRSPGIKVTGSFKLLAVGARNRTWMLWKGSKYSIQPLSCF